MGPGLTLEIAEKPLPGGALFRDFRLAVAPGEVLAVVGPSGVGKSSLLRMIAGIDRAYSGRIEIGGRPCTEAPPPGFLFQDSRLLPWLTANQNLRAVAPGLSHAAAADLLRQVGLGDAGDSYPWHLSGGMQRRVALARALSVNSRLLLLDEPFVSLDRALIGDLQALIARIAADTGATILMVSHVAEDAAALADRAVVLAGRPAGIAADIAFDTPRGQRDPAIVARLAAKLAEPARR
jgi:NitT/TauT family transport system ATP-binding protein/sulfonate transport system ATP-binding protein